MVSFEKNNKILSNSFRYLHMYLLPVKQYTLLHRILGEGHCQKLLDKVKYYSVGESGRHTVSRLLHGT